jgi:hypothetical protein
VPTLFSRKSTATVIETTEDTPVVIETHVRAKTTPSKKELGVVTPKRNAARGPAKPLNKKEAVAAERLERRKKSAAMMAGEEWALMARDKGEEKRLVRDVVDSRRNLGTYFFGAMFAVMAVMLSGNLTLAAYGNLLFIVMLVLVLFDSIILSRKIKRVVSERMPKAAPRWSSLYWYGIMRAISFRGMRAPKPKVKVGDPI